MNSRELGTVGGLERSQVVSVQDPSYWPTAEYI
jgi:hypothetical protein